MHDTAFQIGTLAMNIYADLRTDSILEVGSKAVNGSLRENVLPTTRYVGIDIEEGEGVDLVVHPGKPLPVEDSSFDLVMATSVFEHDPCFWMTFLEMCRATKDGGYIYINAPSNGVVHRYPQDNWRFYPDSGKALTQWAASQGSPVSLVESFIAKRDNDIWNDFVAVFRKGRITKKLPKVTIHEHVACTDVIRWNSKEIINPSHESEDMILLGEAKRRAEELTAQRDALVEETGTLNDQLTKVGHLQQQQLTQLNELKGDLGQRESELRQRREEIEQTRSELSESLRLLEIEARLRKEAEASRSLHERNRAELERRLDSAERDLGRARDEKGAVEQRLEQRFHEIATLTDLLAETEAAERRARQEIEWLCETSLTLMNGSSSLKGGLLALLPGTLQQKRQRRSLKRKGLFDDDAYLAAHPDVARDGADPLRHYLLHGLLEERPRG